MGKNEDNFTPRTINFDPYLLQIIDAEAAEKDDSRSAIVNKWLAERITEIRQGKTVKEDPTIRKVKRRWASLKRPGRPKQ